MAGGDSADRLGEVQGGGADARRAAEDRRRGQAGAFHVAKFLEQAEAVRHAARAGVAAGDDRHADFMGAAEHLLMAFDDSLEMADDLVAPAEVGGAVDLQLHGRKGWHPADLAVAHHGELFVRDEVAVFDGGDAAVDRVLDAFDAGSVGKRLPAVYASGVDERHHFGGRHLRRRGNAADFEVDDAAHEQLDAIGAGVDPGRDAVGLRSRNPRSDGP